MTDSELIALYLEGKLDPLERFELEKRALEDPFLADALEGYQVKNVPASRASEIVEQMAAAPVHPMLAAKRRSALSGKPVIAYQRKVSYSFYYKVGIAASVLLLAGGAWYFRSQSYQPDQHSPSPAPLVVKQDVIPLARPVQPNAFRKQALPVPKPALVRKPGSVIPRADSIRNSAPALAESESIAPAKAAPANAAQPESVMQKNVAGSAQTDQVQSPSRSRLARKSAALAKGTPEDSISKERTIQAISKDSTSGLVEVSFKIHRNGKPYHFEVQQSLSPQNDKEALRLIRHDSSFVASEVLKERRVRIEFRATSKQP